MTVGHAFVQAGSRALEGAHGRGLSTAFREEIQRTGIVSEQICGLVTISYMHVFI